jgi:CheY-like chemotaxis protein
MNDQPSSLPEILLVEDEPGDVYLVREAFKDFPCHLHLAEDGREALAFLHRRGAHAGAHRPDLILLDFNLPCLDGREVLTDIKADPQLAIIPVLVLTTSKAEVDILSAYQLHANCYITKPLELDQFIAVIHHIQQFWLTVARLPPTTE